MKNNNYTVRSILAMFVCLAMAPTTFAQECDADGKLVLRTDINRIQLVERIPICITAPQDGVVATFFIRIKPLNESSLTGPGTVEVREKSDDSPVTIRGKNDSVDNKVFVDVTLKEGETVGPGDEFSFWITVDELGTLDPRVRVVDNEETMIRIWLLQIDATLQEAHGMTLEEVQDLRLPEDFRK